MELVRPVKIIADIEQDCALHLIGLIQVDNLKCFIKLVVGFFMVAESVVNVSQIVVDGNQIGVFIAFCGCINTLFENFYCFG